MCGIAGILTFDGDPARLSQPRLAAMGAALVHRGPDGDGFFVDRERHDIGLVHRRLSIIDLEGGRQPISNEDGSVQVVFNGEIFNYIELREELVARGHRFATHTDTEVIAHLYEDKGADFVHDLNGQFAIALWDARHRRLLLVRDRPGILPLYYYTTPGELVFGSEIKAILAALDRPPAVNPDALRQVMTLWAPLSPETMFEGVLEVEPGQMLVVERGHVSPRQYWQWSLAPDGEALNGRAQDLAEELRALLDDATRIRLRADVPVGAYLSGGLDSSVLTGLVSREVGRRLRTFSIGFEDAAFDETPFQRRMIEFLGADHTQIRCARTHVAAKFLDVVRSAETPVTRTAPVPMALLSAHVRASGFKVVLTGEGADEVLGGYDLFKEAKIRAFCAQNTKSAWRPLLLKRLYPYLDFTRVQSVSVLKSYFGAIELNPLDPLFSHQTRWITGAWTEEFLTPDFRQRFGPETPMARVIERLGAGLEGRGVFHRAQFLEARTLMSGYLLASQGDRMLMANSVEGRFPYLDHRVIEFANRLDPRLKMRVLNEKYLLKQASHGLIPPEILNRPKQPYRAPDAVAFLGDQSPEYIGDLLNADTVKAFGYFDPTKVGHLTRKLTESVRNGRPVSHRDSLTWVTVLSTQAWHEQFQRRS